MGAELRGLALACLSFITMTNTHSQCIQKAMGTIMFYMRAGFHRLKRNADCFWPLWGCSALYIGLRTRVLRVSLPAAVSSRAGSLQVCGGCSSRHVCGRQPQQCGIISAVLLRGTALYLAQARWRFWECCVKEWVLGLVCVPGTVELNGAAATVSWQR
jgi:hypothetical protein